MLEKTRWLEYDWMTVEGSDITRHDNSITLGKGRKEKEEEGAEAAKVGVSTRTERTWAGTR